MNLSDFVGEFGVLYSVLVIDEYFSLFWSSGYLENIGIQSFGFQHCNIFLMNLSALVDEFCVPLPVWVMVEHLDSG
jgi:hypothetical protein